MKLRALSGFLVLCLMPFSVLGEGESLPWMQGGSGDPPRRPGGEGASDPLAGCPEILANPAYRQLAERLPELVGDRGTQEILERVGVQMRLVSWQDTGRHFGSSGGNNISDVRLAAIVRDRVGPPRGVPQPVIRLPNFEDLTVDIDMSQVLLPMGNQWGVPLFAVDLQTVLDNLPAFLRERERLKGDGVSLYLPERDRQVLVSAQASIMPVPRGGEAHFVPTIFNYQSTEEHPAVLVILVTNRGTSITVIDNTRDKLESSGFGGNGQMLFHNDNGEKKPFTLEALKSVTGTGEGQARLNELASSGQAIAGQSGVNQVIMIQVPLRYPNRERRVVLMAATPFLEMASAEGLDTGVVDVANYSLGTFVELGGHGPKLERDPDVPVRVDVTYYMATDTEQLTPEEVASLPELLRGVYEAGSNLGSLVTDPGLHRLTRNYRPWDQAWWQVIVVPYIPRSYRSNPGRFFRPLYGMDWVYYFSSEEAARQMVAGLERQDD